MDFVTVSYFTEAFGWRWKTWTAGVGKDRYGLDWTAR